MIDSITSNQVKLVRTLFGIYLTVHFAYLIPYAAELFSSDGMFPAELSLVYGYFPNPLFWIDDCTTGDLLID